MVAPQAVFQQSHDAVGQGQGHRQHDAQQHQTVDRQAQTAPQNVRGEDRDHHKAHQRPLVVIHGVKGPALLPPGAVAGGDIAVPVLEQGGLVPGELRLAAGLAAGVVKAHPGSVAHQDHVQVRHGPAHGVQLLAELGVGIALLQHVGHRAEGGHIGGGVGDGAVQCLALAGDVQP